MEHEVCHYNQTGFCKFRQHCRKEHENRICQQNHDFKSTGCSLRHPKVCRSFERDGTCKFKEVCAYKHQISQNAEMHAQDVRNLQQEMSQMISMIKQMEDKIEFLEKSLEKITKTNIEEIVSIVVSSLESNKLTVNNKDIETGEDAENCINCDECSYECKDEETMIRHMSKDHYECSSCDLCGTYFGTRHLLEVHNEKEHKNNEQVEDFSDVENEITNHECKQCHLKFKEVDELQWHIKENHNKKTKKSKIIERNKKF